MYVTLKAENRKKSSGHGQGPKINSSSNRKSVTTSLIRAKAVTSRQERGAQCVVSFLVFFFVCVPLYSSFWSMILNWVGYFYESCLFTSDTVTTANDVRC